MQSIIHFFIMISEDGLEDAHKTIMEHISSKENPSPMNGGQGGADAPKALFCVGETQRIGDRILLQKC